MGIRVIGVYGRRTGGAGPLLSARDVLGPRRFRVASPRDARADREAAMSELRKMMARRAQSGRLDWIDLRPARRAGMVPVEAVKVRAS